MIEQAQFLDGGDEHDVSRDTCKMIGRWHAKLLLMASLLSATHLHMFCSVVAE